MLARFICRYHSRAYSVANRASPGGHVRFLFPGQGSQYVGMCKQLLHFRGVTELFEIARRVLGFDLLDVCLNGPAELLNRTDICQPAVVVASLAALESLKSSQPEVRRNIRTQCTKCSCFTIKECPGQDSAIFSVCIGDSRVLAKKCGGQLFVCLFTERWREGVKWTKGQGSGGGGGGSSRGSPVYGLYGDVPLNRVWFLPLWVWNRVYKSERFCLEQGILFAIPTLEHGRGYHFAARIALQTNIVTLPA